jgi:toxin ParE1/3/4
MKLIWNDTPREEVRDVYSFLYDLSPAVADSWSDELEKTVNSLLVFPEMGRVVPEFSISFIREVFAKRHRVVYMYQDDSIRILAVRPMGRPLGKI